MYDLCVSENVTNKSLAMGGEDWADSRTHIRTCTQTYRIYERVCVCVCVCVQEAHRVGNMIGIAVPERHSVHVKGGYAMH